MSDTQSQSQAQPESESESASESRGDQMSATAEQAVPEQTVAEQAQAQEPAPLTIRERFESKFPRGLIIRLIAYLFVGHLFAFFVYLLFVLGGQNQ
ncbi:DUF6126 family protein [Streptomyces katrae]|uniref:DUF6126 family protein n=1 Tax=Streptomyces katrae TaxID=68223 RepID=A0ABT7GKP6_9ACTN|nr:DUF6126 family protein [Streptomyces katrae]MDK9494150.1 DUF6126 family protein [Streptomyces katrae]